MHGRALYRVGERHRRRERFVLDHHGARGVLGCGRAAVATTTATPSPA